MASLSGNPTCFHQSFSTLIGVINTSAPKAAHRWFEFGGMNERANLPTGPHEAG